MLKNQTSNSSSALAPYLRLRGITTVPSFVSLDIATVPVPASWSSKQITFEIRAANITHYVMSAGPSGQQSQMMDVGFAPGLGLTWGFTGKISPVPKQIGRELMYFRSASGSVHNHQWRKSFISNIHIKLGLCWFRASH